MDEIRTGRGFVVLRGLNVADCGDEDAGTVFWGIGTYLGSAVPQNPCGDLLGHVYDHCRSYGAIDVRGYETKAHLPFHSDGCDLVGLLCLRAAKSGGLSSIVSSVTIHNEVLRRHPEYLEPLYRGFHYIRREAALTGGRDRHDGHVHVRRQCLDGGQRWETLDFGCFRVDRQHRPGVSGVP